MNRRSFIGGLIAAVVATVLPPRPKHPLVYAAFVKQLDDAGIVWRHTDYVFHDRTVYVARMPMPPIFAEDRVTLTPQLAAKFVAARQSGKTATRMNHDWWTRNRSC